MTLLIDLSGRCALITGAGVGIGRAAAESLAAAGATVGVHYFRSADEAAQTVEAIRSSGGIAFPLQADLTIEDEANRLVDQFVEQTGRLDVLVNNAGGPIERAKLEECSTEVWRKTFDLNVTSAFVVTRRAIPQLRASGQGSIVNILSLSVQTGGAGGAGAYAAAKGALQVMTRTLARELAPEIRVNALMPGVIETRHHEVFTRPERMEEYRQETPLGRNGQAAEVAQAVTYLAGDASSFVNGALIDINGGRFLR